MRKKVDAKTNLLLLATAKCKVQLLFKNKIEKYLILRL